MNLLNIDQIVEIARTGNTEEWDNVVDFLKNQPSDNDDLKGIRFFLDDNNWSRAKVVEFTGEISSLSIPSSSWKSFKVPAWVMVAAASVVMAAGLYINSYVQHKSLHIIEAPLPVYLSINNDALFNKAMSLYKKGEYEKAVYAFNRVETDTAIYYKAVCLEMLGFNQLSETALMELPHVSEYYNLARIRLAAIYIDAGLNDKASGVVKNIKPANTNEAKRLKSVKVRLQ